MSTTENFNSINTNDFSDYLKALMVLQRAEEQNELDAYFRVLAKKFAKEPRDEKAPFSLVNTVFSPESIAEVKSAYADIWKEIHAEIEERNKASGDALTAAGYSEAERAQFSPALQHHFDTVRVFEERFPTAENQDRSMVVRLWDSKDQLFDALASPGGKKALEAAGWAVSLATGGIVTKLAFRGTGYLASQLAQNEAVQNFAAKMQGRIGSFLERTGVPTGVIAARFAGMKENAKAVLESPTFQRYGKPTLALAGVAMGVMMLGEVNHDKIVELANTGFTKATDLASTGLELGSQGVQYAASGIAAGADAIANGVSAAVEAVEHGTSAALSSVANAGSVGASYINQATDLVADLAVHGYDAATTAVSDTANSVTTAVGDGITQARESLADGLHGLAAQISPEQHSYAAATGLDEAPEAPAVASAPVAPAAPAVTSVVVAKGDSLWKIAEAQFEANGIDPTNAQIQAAAKDLYEANRDVIGANADRIFPGQALKVDPAIFGVEPVAHVPAAPVVPAAPIPVTSALHEKVANLGAGGGLQTGSFKDILANLARPKVLSDNAPAL